MEISDIHLGCSINCSASTGCSVTTCWTIIKDRPCRASCIEFCCSEHWRGGSQSISQHLEHHLHTNDFRRDPDWTFFAVGRNWIRRHPCNPWQPYNAWQDCLCQRLSVLLYVSQGYGQGAVADLLNIGPDQTLYWLPVKCILEPVSASRKHCSMRLLLSLCMKPYITLTPIPEQTLNDKC